MKFNGFEKEYKFVRKLDNYPSKVKQNFILINKNTVIAE